MAERKTTGKTGKSSSASRSKKAAELEAQRIREEAMRRSTQRRRVVSVIFFAMGILLTLLALIPGSMGWRVLYDVMHGLFGFIAWAVGPLMLSAAFVIASPKTHSSINITLLKRLLFMFMLCAAVEIFAVGKVNGENFFKVIENLYINGLALSGGGVFAVVLGVPLLFLGKLGACIVIIILAIVCVLLMIEKPLPELFSGIGGGFKSAQASVSEKLERRREERSITDEQYLELERRDQERKALAREEKRRAREESKRRIAGYYEADKKREKIKEMRKVVNSVGEADKQESDGLEKPEIDLLERTGRIAEAPVVEKPENDLPEPLKPQPSKIRMPKVSDAAPLIKEQDSDNRDYQEALRKYMERKHPIMRDPEPVNTDKFEDSDAELVPLIDTLDKLNSEKGSARVSKIMDAPKSDVTTSDREAEEERRAAALVAESIGDTSDDIDIDEAELAFDLEDIIAENAPGELNGVSEKAPEPPKENAASVNAKTPERSESEQYKLSEVYTLPPMSLLDEVKKPVKPADIETEIRNNADKLVKTLESFGVKTTYLGASRGPSVTRYELQLAPGVKISKISSLADDVALNLAVGGVRIAPVPDKPAVGIEIPNKVKDTVFFRELVDTAEFKKTFDKKLVTVLGKDISGDSVTCNVTKMPHLLIAGTTGSGKSVCVNSIIMSVLMKSTPDDVRFIMVDPKQVEFMMYNGIPHLLIPVVTEPKKAAGALAWAVTEMENRYTLFSENFVRNIDGYNDLAKDNSELEHMPHIVIFIDELADLMMASPKDVEDSIVRLAQKARAAGMHLVIATQKPTVQVVTGLIKSNIPSRIALLVSSNSDSRVILDAPGAEKLLGNGDMLYMPVGNQKPVRLQGCYVADSEIERVVEFIKQTFEAVYDENIIAEIERQAEMVSAGSPGGKEGTSDDLDDSEQDGKLEEAIDFVIEQGRASTSLLQRHLGVGYGRAARLIDTMEKMGVVGGFEGSKPRQVLMTRQEWYEWKMRK